MLPLLALVWTALSAPAHAADCPPLDRLSEGATTGVLSDHAVECLEATVTSSAEVKDKLDASRLLIANAYASGKKTDWVHHLKRHLDELDANDGDLALAYAAHLLEYGAPKEALIWSEHTLKRRYFWDGRDDKDDKLYEALKLRTRAAQAEMDALPPETTDMDRKAHEARIRLFAIEWLAHASSSERDPTEALASCVKAGWEADRCRERAAGL